jgi:protease IV
LYKEHLGLGYETVGTSPNSTFGRPDQPLNAAQSGFIQHMVNNIYAEFLGIVARGRNLDTAYVNSIGQGRVWPGNEALRNGLADVEGGLEKAIAIAAGKANLKNYRLVELPEQRFDFGALFGALNTTEASLQEVLGSDYEIYRKARAASKLSGYQMRMVWDFDIR